MEDTFPGSCHISAGHTRCTIAEPLSDHREPHHTRVPSTTADNCRPTSIETPPPSSNKPGAIPQLRPPTSPRQHSQRGRVPSGTHYSIRPPPSRTLAVDLPNSVEARRSYPSLEHTISHSRSPGPASHSQFQGSGHRTHAIRQHAIPAHRPAARHTAWVALSLELTSENTRPDSRQGRRG